MAELSTFGAILSFAVKLEKQAAAYYERAVEAGGPGARPEALAALAQAHRKRQQVAERLRRENVTEMILEPIYGLREEDWQFDPGAPGSARAAALEGGLGGFYAAAAGKVSIPQVARALRRLAAESARLQEQARSLP